MRISLGDTQISTVMPGSGPVVGCLQNSAEGMFYVPRAGDPPGYYDASAPLCYSDVAATPMVPANVPAAPSAPLPDLPTLTPLNITQPLPAIQSTLAPSPVQVPDLLCKINTWISNNPLWAGAILAAGAWIGLRRKGTRR